MLLQEFYTPMQKGIIVCKGCLWYKTRPVTAIDGYRSKNADLTMTRFCLIHTRVVTFEMGCF